MNFSDSSGIIRSIFEMPPKLEPKYKLWVPRFGKGNARAQLMPSWTSAGTNYFFKVNAYVFNLNEDTSSGGGAVWFDGRTSSHNEHARWGLFLQYNKDGNNCFNSYYGHYNIDGIKYAGEENTATLYENRWSSLYVGDLNGQIPGAGGVDSPKSITYLGAKYPGDRYTRKLFNGCFAYLILQDSDDQTNTRHYPMVLDQEEKPTTDKVYDIFDPSGQRYIQLSSDVEWIECPPGLSNWAERYSDEF